MVFGFRRGAQLAISDLQRRRIIKRVSVVSMSVNAVLALIKITAGLIFGSLAVVSDGINSFSDIFIAILIIVAAIVSTAPMDKNHNYGHEKLEPVFTKVLAVVLFATGVAIIWSAVGAIISPTVLKFNTLLLVVTIISILAKEFLFRYIIFFSKKLNSISLKADAWNHRTDSFSSLAVLLGLVGTFVFDSPYFESVAAIVVALLIIYMAVDIYISSVKQVTDLAVEPNVLEDIKRIVNSIEGVKNIDELKTRISGDIVYVDIEIAVDANLTVLAAHDIAEEVHTTLEASPHKIKHVTVHVNPFCQCD